MTETSTMTLPRRVTIVAPETRIDLALPVQATVGEIVQQVVHLLGEQPSDGAGAGAWTLGRIGQQPLEPSGSVLASDIHDGDVLQLVDLPPQQSAAIFDDVVDAVAEASRSGADRWTPHATRVTSLVASSLLFLGGAVALGTLGAPVTLATAVAAGATVVLLLAAAGLSRAVGDAAAGFACGLPALAYAFVSAALPTAGPVPQALVNSNALVVGGAAVAVTSLLGGLAVGRFRSVFAAGVISGSVCALAAMAQALFLVSAASMAAVVAALAVTAITWLPLLSVRLARLPRPLIPADMAEFRQDEVPTSGASMMAAAQRGGRVLTWLLVALTVVVAGCVVALIRADGDWESVLVGLLALALLLRARRMPGVWQRLVLIVAGAVIAVALITARVAQATPAWREVTAGAAGLLAIALIAVALRTRRRGATPYAARLVDVIESLALASIIPVAAAVLGLYSRLRGAGG